MFSLLLWVFGVEQLLFVGRAGGVVGLSCFVGTIVLWTSPSLLSSVSNCQLLLQAHFSGHHHPSWVLPRTASCNFSFTSADITILVGLGLELQSDTSGALIDWGNNVFSAVIVLLMVNYMYNIVFQKTYKWVSNFTSQFNTYNDNWTIYKIN